MISTQQMLVSSVITSLSPLISSVYRNYSFTDEETEAQSGYMNSLPTIAALAGERQSSSSIWMAPQPVSHCHRAEGISVLPPGPGEMAGIAHEPFSPLAPSATRIVRWHTLTNGVQSLLFIN